MISFFKLIRYRNLLMLVLTMSLTKYALINSFLNTTYLSDFQFIILVLSVILIAASGNIINDIYDIEADKINKPHNLIINNTISLKNGWLSFYTTGTIGILLGTYISTITEHYWYSLIFISTFGGLYFYSYKPSIYLYT